MDPAQALADLTEISAQVEAALLLDDSGVVLASTAGSDATAATLAEHARALLEAADEAAPAGRVAQLEATFRDGSVLAVRDGSRAIVATTGPRPTSGLVLYDLRTCLRNAGELPKKRTRTRKKKETDAPA